MNNEQVYITDAQFWFVLVSVFAKFQVNIYTVILT